MSRWFADSRGDAINGDRIVRAPSHRFLTPSPLACWFAGSRGDAANGPSRAIAATISGDEELHSYGLLVLSGCCLAKLWKVSKDGYPTQGDPAAPEELRPIPTAVTTSAAATLFATGKATTMSSPGTGRRQETPAASSAAVGRQSSTPGGFGGSPSTNRRRAVRSHEDGDLTPATSPLGRSKRRRPRR
ncbi:hypothetical protein ZWY2020_058581 [Hordeum vulgare]|nr:hypothetical protein ZWY2020_058581 [Hordeum vulgare]